MRQMIMQEAFGCDNCHRIEVRQKVIDRDWITIEVGEYVIKDFCCKECGDAFKEENHMLQKEQEACHGL